MLESPCARAEAVMTFSQRLRMVALVLRTEERRIVGGGPLRGEESAP